MSWLLFPRPGFNSFTVAALPPRPSGPVSVESRNQKSFSKPVVRKFPGPQGDGGKGDEGPSALKRSYRLSPMVVSWQLGQHNSMMLLEGGHLPPCFLLPKHTYPLLSLLICSQMHGPALSLAPAPALVSPFGRDTCC